MHLSFYDFIENLMRKGEIADYQHFLPFALQIISKTVFFYIF